jgi:hypothetical protein
MPVIPVDMVVDKKRIVGKNGGPRRRRGTRGCCPGLNPTTSQFTTTTPALYVVGWGIFNCKRKYVFFSKRTSLLNAPVLYIAVIHRVGSWAKDVSR